MCVQRELFLLCPASARDKVDEASDFAARTGSVLSTHGLTRIKKDVSSSFYASCFDSTRSTQFLREKVASLVMRRKKNDAGIRCQGREVVIYLFLQR